MGVSRREENVFQPDASVGMRTASQITESAWHASREVCKRDFHLGVGARGMGAGRTVRCSLKPKYLPL